MKRVRGNISTNGNGADIVDGRALISAYSEILGRAQLASRLGKDTYGGTRDIYQALGYPKSIQYEDYWGRYLRQDIAKAVIDRPVKASWKGEIKVIEDINEEKTPFEKAWRELYDKLQLKSIFLRADKLTGIGRYSVILLGLNDISKPEQFALEAKPKKGLELLYAKPIPERYARITTFEINPTSKRFGLPLMYEIEASDGNTSSSFAVHHTRIIHITEDLTENEVFGTPRLQAVYNRLIDLEKIVGGDGEMFWRGARPGYTGEVDADYQMSTEAYNDLQDQITEFENNLRRILVNQGVKYEALKQQIADPSPHVDVQINLVSSVTGIPKRILMGSERGELSSAQDKQEYVSYVTSRREEQNEPMILRPFINRCIELGLVPKPEVPYRVIWDKLFSLSDEEKAKIGKLRAEAIKDYTDNGIAQELMPIAQFAKFVLALDDTQIEELMEYNNAEKAEELGLALLESEIMKNTKPPTATKGKKVNPQNNKDNV